MVMKKILLLLFFVTAYSVLVSAQDDTSETNSIPKTRTFSGDCIDNPVLNNVSLNAFTDKVLIGSRRASTREVINMMRITSPKSYKMHSTGKGLMTGGGILLATGGGLLLGGGVCLGVAFIVDFEDDYDNSDLWAAGSVLAIAGASGMVASIPLLVSGKSLKNKAMRNFKQNCLSDDPFRIENQYQLNLNVNKNGLGLALVF